MRYDVITPPESEPITLTEAKLHCAIDSDFTDDDDYISNLITAARLWIESQHHIAIGAQTIRLRDNCFPTIIRPPLVSVTSITYYSGGVLTTWSSDDYIVITGTPAEIYHTSTPGHDSRPDAVTTTYVAGVTADERIKQATGIMVQHWYEIREPVVMGSMQKVPYNVDSLIAHLNWGYVS